MMISNTDLQGYPPSFILKTFFMGKRMSQYILTNPFYPIWSGMKQEFFTNWNIWTHFSRVGFLHIPR